MVGKFIAIPAIMASASLPPPPTPDSVSLLLTRLALDLRVDYSRQAIEGSVTLVLRNTAGRPVASVPLLLNRLMSVSRVVDGAGAMLSFDQRIAVFRDDSVRQVNHVAVRLHRPLRSRDSVTVTLEYGGILVGYTETGSRYIQDHVTREFTIIREDAYAFPVLGAPSWATNRTIPREPFAFTARVTVPADLVVAMGGELAERTERDSLTTWRYQGPSPVPFLNITVAPYQQLDGPATRIFYFPADSAGARLLQDAVMAALDRLAAWYGRLPHQPRLVVIEIPEGFGSQASLTAGIIQTADAFRARSELRQVYHELSHLWNVADLEHPSPRWNEGLATFLQWRLAADLDGWDLWDTQLQRTVKALLDRCAPSAPCSTVPFEAYGEAGLTDRSYPVGLLMFYALYRVLGAEAFDRAYHDLVQEHWDTGATTGDLVAAFRRQGPSSEAVFADWLTTTRWYSRLASGESLSQIIAGYTPH
jgi:hypothetical protein